MQGAESKKDTRCTACCFTINNYTDQTLKYLDDLYATGTIQYLLVGKEVGAEGTPHLQGYLQFKTRSRYAKLATDLKAHFEVARGTLEDNQKYCKKDGDWWEKGEAIDRKAKQYEQGEKQKAIWDHARKCAEEGNFAEIPSDIYMRYHSNIHAIFAEHMPKLPSLTELNNYWIGGPSGVGKSTFVRTKHPDVYNKQKNKWWDGYENQEVIVIEEVQPEDEKWITYFLKIGADHYPFIAEIKRRSIAIRPKQVYVTSNYSIEEVITRRQDIDAIRRRFKVIHMDKPFNWIPGPPLNN